MTGRRNRPHHQGSYARRAAAVRAAAWANPDTRCWRCHLTHAEYAEQHGEAAADWDAGHPDLPDGTPDYNGQLQPEHARCNRSHGAEYGNQQREPRIAPWMH